jgi:integrase
MVFRQRKGHAFKVRVTDDQGRSATLTTGAHDHDAAHRVGAMLARFVGQGADAYDVRRLLVSKRVSLPEVYYAYSHGTLDALLKEVSSPDLDPLITEWSKTANGKYVKQCRHHILVGVVYPASRFTRSTISTFLAGLHVSGSTKIRYRAALSVFAGWLVERGVIDHNPVRSVKAAKPNPARELWLERQDAIHLVKQLPAPFNAVEAILANGVERGVVEKLERKDIDLKQLTIHARGSKTPHRNRVIRITEAWTVPIIKAHLATLLPNAKVFDVKMDRVLDTHKRISAKLKIQVTTLHDWRHTYAVNSLRDGMKPTTVARQLGHRDASLVHKVYGRFIVDERDYATTFATTVKQKREGQRGK